MERKTLSARIASSIAGAALLLVLATVIVGCAPCRPGDSAAASVNAQSAVASSTSSGSSTGSTSSTSSSDSPSSTDPASPAPGATPTPEPTSSPAATPSGPPAPLVLVTRKPLADPGIFKDGPFYYVFGTGKNFFRTQGFTRGDAEWFEMSVDFGEVGKGAFDFWAFRVFRDADGSYHAYAGVHFPWFRTVIGHFLPEPGQTWTDEKPIMRWRLDKILVGNVKLGYFSYDPEIVRDDNGDLYILYCSGSPNEVTGVDIHIKARRMLDAGNVDPDYEPRALLSPEGFNSEYRNPGFVQILEGARARKINGKWTLLYSVGDFSGCNYKLGAAYSDTLIPPAGEQYKKLIVPDPANLWKNEEKKGEEIQYLLQSEHREWPAFIGDAMCGPGHGTLVNVDGQEMLVFHGRRFDANGKPSEGRFPWTLPVEIRISPDTPMTEWIKPVVPAAGGSSATTPASSSKK